MHPADLHTWLTDIPRTLHIRLLLLRPILSNFILSDVHESERSVPTGSLLTNKISLQCAIVCVTVAQEAIDIVYREENAEGPEKGLLAAWWYNVLFLYSSATVLIAARLSDSILAEISEESILESWRKAIEVLDTYSQFGTTIHRMGTTLKLLFDAVPQQYSRIRQQARQDDLNGVSIAQHNQSYGHAPPAYTQPTAGSNFTPNIINDARVLGGEETYNSSYNDFLNFDTAFDSNDLSWLMTVPLDN